MPRERFIFKWDDETKQMVRIQTEAPAELHYVQDDTIPPTVSHATTEGKVFTSRAALYEHYKQNGYEVTGGDHYTGKGVFDWKYKADRDDIRRDVEISLNKIKWGMAPTTEKEKELCTREERQYESYRKERETLEKARRRR